MSINVYLYFPDIPAALATWNSGTTYTPGQLVSYNNYNYKATQWMGTNLNQQPNLSFGTYWASYSYPVAYTNANAHTAGYYFDVSSQLLNQYEVDYSVFNQDFKHVVNQCKVTLANTNSTLFQALLNSVNQIRFELYENGTLTFSGLLDPDFTAKVNNGYDSFQLLATDNSYQYDVQTQFSQTFANLYLHDTTNNANSALYQILNGIFPTYGYSVPTIQIAGGYTQWPTSTQGTINTICVPANTKLSDFLEELCFDYCCQYSLANGVLTLTPWNISTASTSNTIANIADGTFVANRKSSVSQEDSIEVDVQFLDANTNITLYNSSTSIVANGQTGYLPMTIVGADGLTGLQFSPTYITFTYSFTSTGSTYWDWPSLSFKTNTDTNYVTLAANLTTNGATCNVYSWQNLLYFGTGTITAYWGNYFSDSSQNNSIKIFFNLPTANSGTITQIAVNGNCISQSSAIPVYSGAPGPKHLFKKYSAKYISGLGSSNPTGTYWAQTLANALQTNITNNPMVYAFDSEVAYTVGSIYNINIPSIPATTSVPNVNVLIISRNVKSVVLPSGLYKLYSYQGMSLSPASVPTNVAYQQRVFPTAPVVMTGSNTPVSNPFQNGITQSALNNVPVSYTSSGLYMTADIVGFYDSVAIAFTNYFRSDGYFGVGRAGNTMTFNPASNTLTLTGTINASAGTIGAWYINSSTIESGATNSARVILDATNDRMSVVDSTNAVKTAMGYLTGLPIQGSPWDSTKNYATGSYVSFASSTYKAVASSLNQTPVSNPTYWAISTDVHPSTDYGFFASASASMIFDGSSTYTNGSMLLQNDASVVINNNGSPVLRVGNISGIPGFYVNESNIKSGVGYQGFITPYRAYFGNPTGSYFDFNSTRSPSLILSGQFQSGGISTSGSAGWSLSVAGSASFNGPMSTNYVKTNVLYSGAFGGFQTAGVIPGRALPSGGRVYYLEQNLLDQANTAGPWSVSTGSAAYASPSRFGDYSLSPASAFTMTAPFATNGAWTVEGWFNSYGIANEVYLVEITDPATGNLFEVMVNPAPPVNAGMLTRTFSSGTFLAPLDNFTQVTVNVRGVVYDTINISSGWMFFAISNSGFLIGGGGTTVSQSLTLVGTSATTLSVGLNAGLQLSNLMTSASYGDSLTDMANSFGANNPYGTYTTTGTLITQANNGIRVPYLTADPSTVVSGSLYYNETSNLLRIAINGAWHTVNYT